MDTVRIIAIDPGVQTGFCYAEIVIGIKREENRLLYSPFQVVDDVDDFWNRLEKFAPDYIIMEDFEFRRGKYAGAGGGGLNLFPVQLIGIARLYETKTTARVFLQKASTGKGYYTDAILKKLDLYVRGIPHGMDASRHLLQWCTFGFGNQFIGPQQEFAKIVKMEHFS